MLYDLIVIGVPAEIGGIGSTQQKLRVRPGFDPIKSQIAPDEYFFLSRIDGQQTLRDVLLATGLPVERGIAIVMRLRSLGALLLPGEVVSTAASTAARLTPARGVPTVGGAQTRPEKVAQAASGPGSGGVRSSAAASKDQATTSGARQEPDPSRHSSIGDAAAGSVGAIDFSLSDPTNDELERLAEPCDLSDADRRRILAMARLVNAGDPWNMLGLGRGAEPRALKRAYFKLSKDFHPDRYYGRQLGSFAQQLSHVFEAISRAYEKLVNPDKRGPVNPNAIAEQSQSPQEYAAELFARATALEVGGDPLDAMKLFSAAIRLDPQTKYLRRSASCALAAEQPHTALEHAKKAQSNSPSDPSLARLLATAFKACGKLNDAEDVLVMAMALKSENDVLMAELRNDLAEVRRLLKG